MEVLSLLAQSYRYNYTTSYDSEAGALFSGLWLGIMCFSLIIGIIIYIYTSYCHMKMAENVGLGDKKIFAWIPFLNYYLLVLIAQKDPIWVVLMFVPFVNIVAMVLVYAGIFKRFGKDEWMVLLMFVPFVNYYALWMLAHSKPAN